MSGKHLLSQAAPARQRGRAARKTAGFTLIELMIAMAISLLLVLAMTTLLMNVNRSNSEMSKTNRLIENGRFAMQLLEDDIVHAGFLGGYVPNFDNLTVPEEYDPVDAGSYPSAVPDPCLDYSAANWTDQVKTNLIGIAVQGYEVADPVPSPVLPGCTNAEREVVKSPKPATDVLLVRYMEREVKCSPAENPDLAPVDISECRPDYGVYFQQSLAGESTLPKSGELAYVLAAAYHPDDVQTEQATKAKAALPLTQRDITKSAEIRKYVSSLYYIRDYSETASDGIPTLMRSDFGPVTVNAVRTLGYQPAQAMIEGIEGFRVEYGIDNKSDSGADVDFSNPINWVDPDVPTSPTNRGDGIPDEYKRCTAADPCDVNDLANIVAVRVHVLVRNEVASTGYKDEKTYRLGDTILGPFNDGFKRHLFTRTIRLHNVSARRETP